MSATVFYADSSELATLTNTFSVNGTATDPTTVSLTVTLPVTGTATTYTYAASQITRTGMGVYTKDIACSEAGLWTYEWVGTGAASDAVAGSWMVYSANQARLYCSLDVLKASLGITDTSRDALLVSSLTAAARGIDAYCGRRFYPDATTSARTYRAQRQVWRDSDGEALLVDDIASTTGLVVETGTANGSNWSTVTDYETGPDNALALGLPVTTLRRIYNYWTFGLAAGRIRVTARWGWPAVPDVVVQATLLQAARLYRRKDSPEGVLGSTEWGAIRVSRIDPDVQALTRHLVLPGFA